jgi:hypothetical protein
MGQQQMQEVQGRLGILGVDRAHEPVDPPHLVLGQVAEIGRRPLLGVVAAQVRVLPDRGRIGRRILG